MKTNYQSALLMAVMFCLTPAINAAESWQQVQANGQGEIVLKYVASNGFAYNDENGELTGVTTEIFRDFVSWVERTHHVSLTAHYQVYQSWSDFYASVRDADSGTFGMGNVTITRARWQELDFSPPYMTNIAVLITHEDTTELQQLSDMAAHFAHLDGLGFEGTLHETRLRNFSEQYYPDMTIHLAQANNEIIDRVAAQDRYFAYVDVYNFWRAQDGGAALRQHRIGDEPSEQFGYIMPNRSDWEPVIRAFFEADGGYLESEAYRQIMETHLGSGLADLLDEARRSLVGGE
jgi:ABC-type amino acid transport substrate-binding protein